MERHHENSHRIISFATLISRTLLFLFFYLARSCAEKRIWPCLQSLYLTDWFSVICMVSTILILTLFDIMAMIVPFINVAKGVVYIILLVAGVYPTLWVLDTSLLIVHALVWLWCSQILPLLGSTAVDAQRAARGVANAYEAEGVHLQRIRERFGEHAYLDAEMLDLNRQMLENQARQAEAMRYRQTREETTGVGSSLKKRPPYERIGNNINAPIEDGVGGVEGVGRENRLEGDNRHRERIERDRNIAEWKEFIEKEVKNSVEGIRAENERRAIDDRGNLESKEKRGGGASRRPSLRRSARLEQAQSNRQLVITDSDDDDTNQQSRGKRGTSSTRGNGGRGNKKKNN